MPVSAQQRPAINQHEIAHVEACLSDSADRRRGILARRTHCYRTLPEMAPDYAST